METDIFGYGVAKVTEGLEMLDSIYRNLADMYTDNYRQIKGFLLEEDIEIFPKYCELDEEYRDVVKSSAIERRTLYFCKTCALDCIGRDIYDGSRTQEQEEMVHKHRKYIEQIEKNSF